MSIISLRPHQQSAVDNMSTYDLGQVIMPTGSGKTYTMAQDARASMTGEDQTIVVVGPTIALTNQLSREFLELIDNVNVMHVHSGNTKHFTSTHPQNVWGWCQFTRGHKLIFTTYHSLHRIQESLIKVDTIYFDESHNSVKRQWFDTVSHFSRTAGRCYFFTASPKHSVTPDKPGMNNDTYGDIICEVPVTEMIREGYILPPVFHTVTCDKLVDKKYPQEIDTKYLIKSIQDYDLKCVMVSCKNTTQLHYITNSEEMREFSVTNSYTLYSVTSRYGCFINDDKVSRGVMMNHMRNNTGKYIVFHIEVLCEGINLPKLDGLVLLKKLSTIRLIQSIGRVLRLSEGKTHGKVILPVYSSYLKKSESSISNLMERIYEQGQTPVETIRR